MADNSGGKSEIREQLKENAKEILKLRNEELNTQKEIEANLKKINALKSDSKKLGSQLRDINSDRIKNLASEESSLKSMGSIYNSLVQKDRNRIQTQTKIRNLSDDQEEAVNRTSQIIRQLAQLSSDEKTQIASLNMEYMEQQDILNTIGGSNKSIVASLEEQKELADGYSNMTQKQKDFLQKQLNVYDGIKETISGILETASMLTSTFRGGLGAAIIGAGEAGKQLLNTSYELGDSLTDINNISTTVFGTIFPNAVETTKSLSKEFGGLNDVSLQTQFRTNVIAKNLGISAGEAASLTGSFARLNNGSAKVSQNLIQSTQNLAQANGLVPADIMADLANSTEEFALYGKDGGKNIAEAAVAAGKLGVSMKNLTGITDNLLDFESSINTELELGAMLGKNINLNRARALAYEGDIGGAVKETLSSLGGIEEFNKMDVFSKRKTAELLGVSVGEFQKMAENSDKLNKDGSIQVSQFEQLKNSAKAFGSQILSASQGLGGMLMATGQMKTGLGDISGMFGGIKEKAKGLFGTDDLTKARKTLTDKQISSGFGGKKAKDSLLGKASNSKVPNTSVTEKVNRTSGAKGFKAKNLLKGAAAILVLSAALFVAAKAFQEFGDVTWESVGMGLTSLVGLAGIATILGKAQGQMIKGATAVGILGAALVPFAFAMNLISDLDMNSIISAATGLGIFSAAVVGLGTLMTTGVGAVVFGAGLAALAGLGTSMAILGGGLTVAAGGFKAIRGSMGDVVSLISQTKDVLGDMFQYIAPISALSLSLVGLAGALTTVGIAGLAALPALSAVAAIGTVAGEVGSLLGIDGEDEAGTGNNQNDPLLTEIKALRNDLNDGKVGVYMDGKKLTASISKVVDKVGSNSYVV